MVYFSADDFYEKASRCHILNRQEEIEYARKMQNGDASARDKLIESYTPMVARHVKQAKPHMQNLALVLYCMQSLEKAVDAFDFQQNSEPFSHRLNWYLRQAVVNYIVR